MVVCILWQGLLVNWYNLFKVNKLKVTIDNMFTTSTVHTAHVYNFYCDYIPNIGQRGFLKGDLYRQQIEYAVNEVIGGKRQQSLFSSN